MNDEGALIAFTLLSQVVIGATLVYVLVYFINMDEISRLPAGFSLKTPEFMLLLGLLLAIVLSFLHLGRPSNAINAMNNLKTSWISREIFTVTLFSISLLVLLMARWLGAGRSLLTASFVFAAIAGVFLLVTMVRLYMIPAVPSWNNWLTPAHFTLTALVSGLALLLVFGMVYNIDFTWVKPALLFLMILLLFEMVHAGFLYAQLNSMDVHDMNTFISGGIFKPIVMARIAVTGLAIVLLVLFTLQEKTQTRGTLLILSLSFIFIEMEVGRFVFFATYARSGI
jgi:DMSO reductase anchor subunit